jgi:hypothetical protein
MRAEALLWAGTAKEATDELSLYLNGRDMKSMPLRAKALDAHIQERKKDEVAFQAAAVKAQLKGIVPIDYLHRPPQNLPDFEAISDQSQLKDILAAVGKNVSDLFAGLPNICSVEKVQQEKLAHDGKVNASVGAHDRRISREFAGPSNSPGGIVRELHAHRRICFGSPCVSPHVSEWKYLPAARAPEN